MGTSGRLRIATLLLGVAALSGCKSEDLAAALLGGADLAGAGAESPVSDSEPGESFAFEDPESPASASAVDVLGAYFVRSWDAFEAAAERLRETDPRYTVQENRWRLSAGGEIYSSFPIAAGRFEYAHAAGLTGAGATVSVVDSGFLVGHEVFDGLSVTTSGSVPVDNHGTAVASVVAGRSDTMIGVAPGADLHFGSYGSFASLERAAEDALALGAVAQNNSWGFTVDISTTNYNSFLRNSGYMAALTDFAAEGVVVFAASNDETRTTATLMEALPAVRPDLEDGWIAVINAVPDFDETRVRSATLISAGCLEAARWCITADGTWVSASSSGATSYGFATGSSFAAPQVSGALALLAEAFPDLAPHDLRIRLLASADDGFFTPDGTVELAPGFEKGYSDVFGHGFIDMRAALMPIGETVLTSEGGTLLSTEEPLMVAGGAMGDALSRALADSSVLIADALGGGFSLGGDALVASRAAPPLGADGLARWAAYGGAEPVPAFAGFGGGRVSVPAEDAELTFHLMLPPEGAASEDLGLGVERRIEGQGLALGIGASVIRDGSGTIGVALQGSDPGAWAAALDLNAEARLAERDFLRVSGQFGMVSGAENAVADVAASRFAALGVDLGRRDAFRAGDTLSLGVALPRAITSGGAQMTLPVARVAGGYAYDDIAVDLAPENREVRLSIAYETPLGQGWTLRAEGMHAVNHGNLGGAEDTGALLGLKLRF